MKLYWKGEYLEERQAGALVSEEAYFSGSGLAETLRVRAGRLVDFKLHHRRLSEGAAAMQMPALPELEFRSVLLQLIRINRLKSAGLRCRYFRDGALLAQALPLKAQPKQWKLGIRLVTTAVRHYGPASLAGRLKGSGMLPNILAKAESQAWAEDGLRLSPAGFVAEGIWANVLLEKRGILVSPRLSEGILEGSTRHVAIRRWKAKGRKVQERPVSRHDLYSADRVWVCSSLRGLLPVASVDGRPIGR